MKRRDFLKNVVVGGAGLVALGLAGGALASESSAPSTSPVKSGPWDFEVWRAGVWDHVTAQDIRKGDLFRRAQIDPTASFSVLTAQSDAYPLPDVPVEPGEPCMWGVTAYASHAGIYLHTMLLAPPKGQKDVSPNFWLPTRWGMNHAYRDDARPQGPEWHTVNRLTASGWEVIPVADIRKGDLFSERVQSTKFDSEHTVHIASSDAKVEPRVRTCYGSAIEPDGPYLCVWDNGGRSQLAWGVPK